MIVKPILVGLALGCCFGCSTNKIAVVGKGTVELCEMEHADGHVGRAKFFFQDLTSLRARSYECTMLVGAGERVTSEMRGELEPWCRAKIADSMRFSTTCNKTKFKLSVAEITLRDRFQYVKEGNVYILSGENQLR